MPGSRLGRLPLPPPWRPLPTACISSGLPPHGVIKAAMKNNATAQTQTEGGKKMTTISFMVPGQLKVQALVNERNLVEKVDSWNTNPVLGDMLSETTYTDYKDFGGVQFPTKIMQKPGAFPTLK